MKNLKLFFSIIVAHIFLATSSFAQIKSSPTEIDMRQIGSNGFADIIEDLLPAVVNISTTQELKSSLANNQIILEDLQPGQGSVLDGLKDLLENQKNPDKKRKISSLGSGFIISKDGYIVTNYHVIEDADEIMVGLNDGNKFKAKLIGVDKRTDLALLKINTTYDLKFVKFGDSGKSRIGEWTIVIGNPFGLGGSVSVGIISARGRDITSNQSDDFIQTDAAINKGNSGGPLFNIKGEVIGVATAIYSTSGGNIGIGFATPSANAIAVIKQLKEQGQVIRGWLGVSVQDVTKEMAESMGLDKAKGAFVMEVIKDSPAEQAGIIATDIITKFDGQDIADMKSLPKLVAKTPIGKKVQIVVLRQGKAKILKTKIQKLREDDADVENKKSDSKESPTKPSSYLFGMGLVNLNDKIKKDNKIDDNVSGVLVVEVKPKSVAADKGIEVGDVILSANQKPVKSISDLQSIAEESKKSNRDGIFLFVKRAKLTFATVFPIK